MAKPKGFTRDRYGVRAYVKVGDIQKERRFPRGVDPSAIQQWRKDTRDTLRRAEPPGPAPASFAADVTTYLARVAAMPTIAQRTRHLTLWTAAIERALRPDAPREDVTAGVIRAILQEWRATLNGATCNKRRTALMHLWTVLDGKGASNPVRDVPKFRTDDPLPRGRDPHALDALLRAATPCRSRACCRVMLWTGMRPEELSRATPDDIDRHQKTAIIRTAKGGRTRVIPLTRQALSAWQEFEDLDGWQDVPQAAPLGRWLKDHTGIEDLRVYDLRHTYGTALARSGARLDVIAALMGHSTLELTRRYLLASVTPAALAATGHLARKPRKKAGTKAG